MRAFLFLIAALLATVSAEAGSLYEQDLTVRINPAEQSIDVVAVLSRAATSVQARWDIALSPRADIHSVKAGEDALRYDFAHGLLSIPTAGTSRVAIRYRARFADPVPTVTAGIEDPSFGVRATITGEGVFLSANSAWHPVPVDAESRFRVTVSGPQGWVGVTAGRLLDLESSSVASRTIWETERPMTALTLAAGRFHVGRNDLDDIQVMTFLRDENVPLADDYLASIRTYLDIYRDLFGPYPYAKFAVVENFYPTGYGLPGWTLLGSTVIRLPFIRTTSLPHEIAHAWWGNAVDVDAGSGNWAEGLATYVADYYLKELSSAADAKDYRLKLLTDYSTLVFDPGNEIALKAFRGRMSKRDQAIGYGKAAMVFHMLRRRIGDQAFWQALRDTARDGLGKRYAWSDLQRHFEATARADLSSFFRQWIDRPGAPRLTLEDVAVRDRNGKWLVAGTILQPPEFYELDLPVRLELGSGRREQTVRTTSGRQQFAREVDAAPERLLVDPDYDVFRRLDRSEIPIAINHLRTASDPLVIVAKGAEPLLDAARDLLRGLQWQKAEVMSESEYLDRKPAGRDILVIGWAESSGLRPVSSGPVRVDGKRVTVDGRSYSGPDDVYFDVAADPTTSAIVAHFLPGSIAAAADTARRIPHYGRYSYLAFRSGENRVKSTWDPTGSPLVVSLQKENGT